MPDKPLYIKATSISAAAIILGKKGGSVASKKQKEAARQNGKRGGRPIKYVALFGKKGDEYFRWSPPYDSEEEARIWLAGFVQTLAGFDLDQLATLGHVMTAREAWRAGARPYVKKPKKPDLVWKFASKLEKKIMGLD